MRIRPLQWRRRARLKWSALRARPPSTKSACLSSASQTVPSWPNMHRCPPKLPKIWGTGASATRPWTSGGGTTKSTTAFYKPCASTAANGNWCRRMSPLAPPRRPAPMPRSSWASSTRKQSLSTISSTLTSNGQINWRTTSSAKRTRPARSRLPSSAPRLVSLRRNQSRPLRPHPRPRRPRKSPPPLRSPKSSVPSQTPFYWNHLTPSLNFASEKAPRPRVRESTRRRRPPSGTGNYQCRWRSRSLSPRKWKKLKNSMRRISSSSRRKILLSSLLRLRGLSRRLWGFESLLNLRKSRKRRRSCSTRPGSSPQCTLSCFRRPWNRLRRM